jgi:putative ATP-dependent endonuclease of the OLD family
MDLIVRSALHSHREIKELQDETARRLKALTNPSALPQLADLATDLTGTLRSFYGNTAVALDWQEGDIFSLPLPRAILEVNDDGFQTSVDRCGHGLQRAMILTLLQHLAKASLLSNNDATNNDADSTDAGVTETPPVKEHQQIVPSMILAIEEPELYQHPTKGRHMARVLWDLAHGRLPGVVQSTQVLFATHSPYFVQMERFDDIRLVRRSRANPHEPRETLIRAVALGEIAKKLEVANQYPSGTFLPETLRPRLHIINSMVAEGFFCDVAVLVEGPSDGPALEAAAGLKGINLAAEGIAVLCVDGKSKLDKPTTILSAFGIPTFTMWDCDEKNGTVTADHAKQNRALQRLVELEESEITDAVSRIGVNFACHRINLEETLKSEIGHDVFRRHLDTAKNRFGISRDNEAEKTPAVMREVLRLAADESFISQTMGRIVDAILALKHSQSAEPPTVIVGQSSENTLGQTA